MNIPYFMSNKEWYYRSTKNGTIILTPKAPKEAINSYNKYISEKEMIENTQEIKDMCKAIRTSFRKNAK